MSNWPPVWILFATFKRTQAALNTIGSLEKYLKYPNLHYHICDDGSRTADDGTDRWHVGVLAERVAKFCPEVTWHEMDTAPKTFNTGGNINRGISVAKDNGANIHMLVFDDWALLRELDIRPHADVLDSHVQPGFIRLSYLTPGLGGNCMSYHSDRMNADYMWLRLIRDWSLASSWENDRYMISTQPYIAHTRFFDAYGYHPENVDPGLAEVKLGEQYLYAPQGEHGPQLLHLIGLCTTHAPWGHMVGRSNDYLEIHGIT